MNSIIEHIEVACPTCFESINVEIDKSTGEKLSFVYDCEVCCRPMEISLSLRNNQIENLSVEKS